MREFSATLDTAKGAEATAKLLDRAAGRAPLADALTLKDLAQKYRDYAAGLIAMVAGLEATAEPDPAQEELFT